MFTQMLTPWHQGGVSTPYLEYDGDTQTIVKSNRFECMKGKQCTHFLALHDLGDPFWIPQRIPAKNTF
jgi:hypothetical protein